MSRAASVVPLHALHTGERERPTSTPHGIATAHFGELRAPLLRFIDGSEVVVGCVAWITEQHILTMLAKRPVALVVQKENWWKKTDARGQSLARRYEGLTGGLPAATFPEPLATRSYRGKPIPNDAALAPIACLGYGNGSQHQPLMHHKFIVRCEMRTGTGVEDRLVPTAVWTGSFNFSGNANNSFENAVEIHDPTIAAAYLAEFALAASLSEPMNWRLGRPSPKGLGTVFVAPPVPPKKTTTNVVSGAGRRRAAAKKKTGTPTRKVAAAAAGKKTTTKKTAAAKVTPITRPTKKAAAKATKPTSKTAARRPQKKAS